MNSIIADLSSVFFVPFSLAVAFLSLVGIVRHLVNFAPFASSWLSTDEDEEEGDDIEETETPAALTPQKPIPCCHCGAPTHGYPCEYCRGIQKESL